SATRSVPVDLQGPVRSYREARLLASGIARRQDIGSASAAATAPFAGIVHHGPEGVTSAGKGAGLAVPPRYPPSFQTFPLLRGSLRPGEVVLDQQLAATLRARVGDTVAIRSGTAGAPRRFRVGGIVLVTAPDILFQPLNPQLGPAPAQPPANVA